MLSFEEMMAGEKKSPRVYTDREVFGVQIADIQTKRGQLRDLDGKLGRLEDATKQLGDLIAASSTGPAQILADAKARVDEARNDLDQGVKVDVDPDDIDDEANQDAVMQDMAAFRSHTLDAMATMRESLPHLHKQLTKLEKDTDPTLPKSLRKTYTPFETWEATEQAKAAPTSPPATAAAAAAAAGSAGVSNNALSPSSATTMALLGATAAGASSPLRQRRPRRMHTAPMADTPQRNIWNDFFFNSRSFSNNTHRKQQLIVDPKTKITRSPAREPAVRVIHKKKRPARIIELVPLGPFARRSAPSLEQVRSFMARLLGVECVLAESLPLTEINKVFNDSSAVFRKKGPVAGCRKGKRGQLQLAINDIVEVLKQRRRRKALGKKRYEDGANTGQDEKVFICSIAVTMADVYSYHDGEQCSNFDFGCALLRDGAGVFSFARCDPTSDDAGLLWEGRPNNQNYALEESPPDARDAEGHSWALTAGGASEEPTVGERLDAMPVTRRSVTIMTHESGFEETHCVIIQALPEEEEEEEEEPTEGAEKKRRKKKAPTTHPHKLCPVSCRWGHSTVLEVKGTGSGGTIAGLLQEFGWMKSDLPPTLASMTKSSCLPVGSSTPPPSRFVDNYGRRRTRKAGPWSDAKFNRKKEDAQWANPLQEISICYLGPPKADEIDKWLDTHEHVKPVWPFTSTSWDADGKLMMHDVNPMVLTDKH